MWEKVGGGQRLGKAREIVHLPVLRQQFSGGDCGAPRLLSPFRVSKVTTVFTTILRYYLSCHCVDTESLEAMGGHTVGPLTGIKVRTPYCAGSHPVLHHHEFVA